MPRVDFLILANHTDVQGGLLNLLGGGWNQHVRTLQPDGSSATAHFGIAVGVAFDQNDINQARLWVRIESDNGEEIMRAEGDISVGSETVQVTRLVTIALNANILWPRSGTYHLMAGLAQDSEKRFSFRVVDNPTTTTGPPGTL